MVNFQYSRELQDPGQYTEATSMGGINSQTTRMEEHPGGGSDSDDESAAGG